MPPRESPQDVYARLLMQKDASRGYPLYTPEPDESLPASYRKRGIRIGDLGVIAEDGGFDFLFNLCLPGDHEFNRVNGVPETFRQVELRVGEEQDHEDVRVIRNADREGQTLSTCSIVRLNLDTNSEGQVLTPSATAGLGFHFSTSATEGAILVLPDGSEKRDLKNGLHKLQKEAKKNARSWYQFISCNLGRITNNDSLYVVTGYHKASSWCLASFSQEEGSAAISLTLRARPFIGIGATVAYNWEMTNSVVGRVGPQVGYNKAQRNQAVFVRGFKIAIREGLLAVLRGEVKVTSSQPPKRIDTSRPWNPERPHRGASSFRPPGTNNLSSSQEGGHAENDLGDETTDENTHSAQEQHLDVSLQHMPSSSLKTLHPSDVINKFLLDKFPTANLAITHDSQWMDLSMKSSEHDLIEQVCKLFTPVYDPIDGVVYLELKETAVEYVGKPVDEALQMIDYSGQFPAGPPTYQVPFYPAEQSITRPEPCQGRSDEIMEVPRTPMVKLRPNHSPVSERSSHSFPSSRPSGRRKSQKSHPFRGHWSDAFFAPPVEVPPQIRSEQLRNPRKYSSANSKGSRHSNRSSSSKSPRRFPHWLRSLPSYVPSQHQLLHYIPISPTPPVLPEFKARGFDVQLSEGLEHLLLDDRRISLPSVRCLSPTDPAFFGKQEDDKAPSKDEEQPAEQAKTEVEFVPLDLPAVIERPAGKLSVTKSASKPSTTLPVAGSTYNQSSLDMTTNTKPASVRANSTIDPSSMAPVMDHFLNDDARASPPSPPRHPLRLRLKDLLRRRAGREVSETPRSVPAFFGWVRRPSAVAETRAEDRTVTESEYSVSV